MRQIPIKDIRISAIGIRICILPDRLKRPPARNRPRPATPASQHKRTCSGKRGTIARTSLPPVRIGVDHRITPCLAVVGVDEILDPGYHGRRGLAVAFRFVGRGFHVDHAGEGYAVTGPAPAMREEECRLGAAGTEVGAGEVVAAADEAGLGGTGVVAREVGVNETCAFCGL